MFGQFRNIFLRFNQLYRAGKSIKLNLDKINLFPLLYILLMKLAPRIYTIHNGELKPKDQNIEPRYSQPCKVIKYTHTVRATPDDYHTDLIKQYKQQNQQLRKEFKDLQKAYWGLLGYCQSKLEMNVNQFTPIHSLYKDGLYPNSTQICDSSKYSSANVSSFELDEIMRQTEESRKKVNRLSESILEEQQIQQFRRNIKNDEDIVNLHQGQRSRNAKTEVDEDIQDLLMQAFKQVQQLRDLLENVKSSSIVQIQQIRSEYDEKIKNLECLLEKQRKQSRMLNGVINRMREELQSKQNFFRAVKEVKNGPEKNLLQKLMKQHRLSY